MNKSGIRSNNSRKMNDNGMIRYVPFHFTSIRRQVFPLLPITLEQKIKNSWEIFDIPNRQSRQDLQQNVSP